VIYAYDELGCRWCFDSMSWTMRNVSCQWTLLVMLASSLEAKTIPPMGDGGGPETSEERVDAAPPSLRINSRVPREGPWQDWMWLRMLKKTSRQERRE
jgi:hypothetical protein